MLEPRIQIGTSSPAPGTACTAWPGSARLEIAHQLDDVLRKLVDVAVQVAPHRPAVI